MTTSTDAQICFGIRLHADEDGEWSHLPWEGEPYYGDMEEWWCRAVQGYKNPFELYDETGEYIDGIEPPKEKRDEYYNQWREFKKSHPLPVKLVNACHIDYPEWILSTGVYMEANRGYPIMFDPALLVFTREQYKLLIDFCATHKIDIGSEQPQWWLSSYWG